MSITGNPYINTPQPPGYQYNIQTSPFVTSTLQHKWTPAALESSRHPLPPLPVGRSALETTSFPGARLLGEPTRKDSFNLNAASAEKAVQYEASADDLLESGKRLYGYANEAGRAAPDLLGSVGVAATYAVAIGYALKHTMTEATQVFHQSKALNNSDQDAKHAAALDVAKNTVFHALATVVVPGEIIGIVHSAIEHGLDDIHSEVKKLNPDAKVMGFREAAKTKNSGLFGRPVLNGVINFADMAQETAKHIQSSFSDVVRKEGGQTALKEKLAQKSTHELNVFSKFLYNNVIKSGVEKIKKTPWLREAAKHPNAHFVSMAVAGGMIMVLPKILDPIFHPLTEKAFEQIPAYDRLVNQMQEQFEQRHNGPASKTADQPKLVLQA